MPLLPSNLLNYDLSHLFALKSTLCSNSCHSCTSLLCYPLYYWQRRGNNPSVKRKWHRLSEGQHLQRCCCCCSCVAVRNEVLTITKLQWSISSMFALRIKYCFYFRLHRNLPITFRMLLEHHLFPTSTLQANSSWQSLFQSCW